MEVDVSQSLKDTENSLRDFIASVLEKVDGPDWSRCCGVSPERLAKWQERQELEVKRQTGGSVDPRLIYYADFYDLGTILSKKWAHFKDTFEDQSRLRVYLNDLEKLRNPDAHRRELLPHQKHLALGIGGELRARILKHRNNADDLDAYFPRIECARDNLGNVWFPKENQMRLQQAKQRLRPGDVLEFVITASDPLGAELLYACNIGYAGNQVWQGSHELTVRVKDNHVGKHFGVALQIKSPRQFHARGNCDDQVEFMYTVLPPKMSLEAPPARE